MGYRLFPSLAEALPLAALILAAVLAAPAGAADPKAAGTPFEALSGDWKGGGTVTPNKGDPMKARIPARRFGEPVEVADLVLFLASAASDFICGQVIRIDGGLSAV